MKIMLAIFSLGLMEVKLFDIAMGHLNMSETLYTVMQSVTMLQPNFNWTYERMTEIKMKFRNALFGFFRGHLNEFDERLENITGGLF